MRIAFVLVGLLLLAGCPVKRYPGNFLNLTGYPLNNVKWKRTTNGIRVWASSTQSTQKLLEEVERKTTELEQCLRGIESLELKPTFKIRRDWFAVYVPTDWYTSTCSPEQLIPSRIDYRLCEQKGLTIHTRCRKVVKPTVECPCPCNARAAIQNNWVIVTAPNLKLLKSELSRLVLWPKFNMPWVKPVSQCLH